MTHTELYVGDAGGLTVDHLGHTITLKGADGASYEGALTYLSFDLTRGEDEAVTVGVAVDDNPVNDRIFHLALTHKVEAEFTR